MFLSEHRLNIPSLRIGKHRIVKNIASSRKVKVAHPYTEPAKDLTRRGVVHCLSTALIVDVSSPDRKMVNFSRRITFMGPRS